MGIPKIISVEQAELKSTLVKDLEINPPKELNNYIVFQKTYEVMESMNPSIVIDMQKKLFEFHKQSQVSYSNKLLDTIKGFKEFELASIYAEQGLSYKPVVTVDTETGLKVIFNNISNTKDISFIKDGEKYRMFSSGGIYSVYKGSQRYTQDYFELTIIGKKLISSSSTTTDTKFLGVFDLAE